MENKKTNSAFDMDRRTFLKASGGMAVALAGGGMARSFAAEPASPPNILLIMTDQQHIDTISAGGCPYVNTPALDKIKRSGVSFTNSYCTNPICSPSRSSVWTGRMPSETGVWKNSRPIRFDIRNVGEWLGQEAGYETVYAGKWHLPSGYSHFIPGFRVLHTGISGVGNVGDTAVSHACEGYLRNYSSSKPFLMLTNFMQPHDICEWYRLNKIPPKNLRYEELADNLPPLPDNFELTSPEPEEVRRRREGWEAFEGHWDERHWRYYLWSYYRFIEQVDGEIGRILRALEETGLEKNTLLIFTSDHGEGLARHRLIRKQTAYDSAAKVPLLISWPGHIPSNQTDNTHLVCGLDFVPTACEYAGVAAPPNMRGASLKPLLEGKEVPWRAHTVTEIPNNVGRMVRSERYKFVTYVNDPVQQLFDMEKDPGETVNLATTGDYSSIVKEHKALLDEWEAKLDVAPDNPNQEWWSPS